MGRLIDFEKPVIGDMGRKSGRNPENPEKEAKLMEMDGRLVLTDGTLRLFADFSGMLPRLGEENLRRELLLRAAKRPLSGVWTAVDATAGLGEDSLLLAAAGFQVLLYEKDPVIAALLEDGMRRGLADPALSAYVRRMELRREDSIPAMRNLPSSPHLIYLDPMFPERTKSAKVKKKFQLLQLLERPCPNGEELLMAAYDASPARIVVKRPAKGEYLAGRKPEYSIRGKAVRYDVYVTGKL